MLIIIRFQAHVVSSGIITPKNSSKHYKDNINETYLKHVQKTHNVERHYRTDGAHHV